MTLKWAKVNFRSDGTIMTVDRCDVMTFTAPNGAEKIDEVVSEVPPEEWGKLLGEQAEAYAAFDVHNKNVEAMYVQERLDHQASREAKIQAEQETAQIAAQKEALLVEHQSVVSEREALAAQLSAAKAAARKVP